MDPANTEKTNFSIHLVKVVDILDGGQIPQKCIFCLLEVGGLGTGTVSSQSCTYITSYARELTFKTQKDMKSF